ncbi:MAG: DNA topoisomerase I, partial [Armatimonadetes bacterium]|nr:DNA topoisomerase I [Armatimonadota bacterium]
DEKGIGRPSTWASFIAIIQERGYVDLIERRFVPTELGFMVNDYLVARFPVVMDLGFTKDMEIQLDEIEEGKAERTTILEGFYTEFERALEEAYRTDGGPKPKPVETEFKCPKCERPMLLRQSDRGPFLGCSGYPRCKTVLNPDGTEPERPQKPEQVGSDQVCPKCGKPMIERTGKYGKFLGCSGFPKCRTIVKIEGEEGESGRPPAERTGVACPKDGGDIVVKRSRRGKVFYGCANYPTCTFSMWDKPTGQVCPTCGWPLAARTWRGKPTGKVKCSQEGCGYEGQGEADVPPDALDGS